MPSALSIAILLLSVASLPLSRRWPFATLLVCLGIFTGISASAPPPTSTESTGLPESYIALLLLSYRSGIAGKLRPALITIGATCIALYAVILIRSTGGVEFVFSALTMALSGLIGNSVRTQRQNLSTAITRALYAEQTREREAKQRVTEERLRIARDLHDAVAHQVAVISLNAGVATAALETRPEKAKEALGTIRSASRAVLREIGDLLAMLRDDSDPDAETALFSPESLRALTNGFVTSGLEVTVAQEGDLRHLRGATAQATYWIIQEALTNAHKHGDGRTSVRVAARAE